MSKVAELHKHMSPKSVGISIVTCSTSKFAQQKAGEKPDDKSGDIIESLVLQAGHRVAGRHLISDSKQMIRSLVRKTISSPIIDALIITGGTGLSPRDLTIESVSAFPSEGDSWIWRTLQEDQLRKDRLSSHAEPRTCWILKGKANLLPSRFT